MREEFNDRKSQNGTEYAKYNIIILICLIMYSRLMHIDNVDLVFGLNDKNNKVV